jgi:hypothetical protein
MKDYKDDYLWYEEKLKLIPGWLEDYAAFRTIDILNWQIENQIHGSVLEIGVFRGLHFSILANSAKKTNSLIMGIDDFQWTDVDQVNATLEGLFGANFLDLVTLCKSVSSRFDHNEIIARIGTPRFISIDGSHEADDVYLDLVLAEKVISIDGLISADDFLNPLTIGVNQAINSFFSQPRTVIPVAYTSNKLFLAHRSRAQDYFQAFEGFFLNAPSSQGSSFVQRSELGRNHIEQMFYGHKILIA